MNIRLHYDATCSFVQVSSVIMLYSPQLSFKYTYSHEPVYFIENSLYHIKNTGLSGTQSFLRIKLNKWNVQIDYVYKTPVFPGCQLSLQQSNTQDTLLVLSYVRRAAYIQLIKQFLLLLVQGKPLFKHRGYRFDK